MVVVQGVPDCGFDVGEAARSIKRSRRRCCIIAGTPHFRALEVLVRRPIRERISKDIVLDKSYEVVTTV
jgi:hypothetical protein